MHLIKKGEAREGWRERGVKDMKLGHTPIMNKITKKFIISENIRY